MTKNELNRFQAILRRWTRRSHSLDCKGVVIVSGIPQKGEIICV
jgi:hypothetical protein